MPRRSPPRRCGRTSGSHTVSGTVSDLLGNASAPGSLTVKVDATDPAVSITCPATDPLQGSTATAAWTASDAALRARRRRERHRHARHRHRSARTPPRRRRPPTTSAARAPPAARTPCARSRRRHHPPVRRRRAPPPASNRPTGIASGTRVGAALLGRRRTELRALIRGTTQIAPGLDTACVVGGTLRIAYPTAALRRGLTPALARAVAGVRCWYSAPARARRCAACAPATARRPCGARSAAKSCIASAARAGT